jgi:phage-related protein (TIGR01555 family)
MGVVQFVRDRLTNVMSGMGTTADRRAAAFYSFNALDGQQAEAGYRSSWLVRKIVDVPPLDMTRAWRDWQTDAPNIEKLEKEERRLQLKAKCQRALILARLYGGSALILGTNDADPSQPLNPRGERLAGSPTCTSCRAGS